MSLFSKELKARAKCQSPPFFKKLGKIGRAFTIIGGGVAAVALALGSAGIAVPAIITAVAAGIATLGETVKQVSGLPVESSGELAAKMGEDK